MYQNIKDETKIILWYDCPNCKKFFAPIAVDSLKVLKAAFEDKKEIDVRCLTCERATKAQLWKL
jgi:hypothetical protein